MFNLPQIRSLGELKDKVDGILLLFGIDSRNVVGDTIKLAMVGATSVGKSRTINALIGLDICHVGHVGNTTREAGWNPYHLSKSIQPDFFLLDLPGWGVSRSVDAEYKTILKENLPKADAVLWIIKADSLGTLAYDLEWIEKIVLPSLENNSRKLVIGINQIENVYDYNFANDSPSEVLRNTLNQKCQLIHTEVKKVIPDFSSEQIQPYSAVKRFRVLPLLRQLVYAAGEQGWTLELISRVTEENDPFFRK
jgi:predicted GTPase